MLALPQCLPARSVQWKPLRILFNPNCARKDFGRSTRPSSGSLGPHSSRNCRQQRDSVSFGESILFCPSQPMKIDTTDQVAKFNKTQLTDTATNLAHRTNPAPTPLPPPLSSRPSPLPHPCPHTYRLPRPLAPTPTSCPHPLPCLSAPPPPCPKRTHRLHWVCTIPVYNLNGQAGPTVELIHLSSHG